MWDIWREEAYVWRTWPSLARPMFILCASWGVRLKMTNCMFCELTAWMMHYYHKKQNCCCRSTLSMFAVTGSAVGTACKTTACVVLSSNNYVALVHCHNNEPTIHVIYYHIPLCFICGRWDFYSYCVSWGCVHKHWFTFLLWLVHLSLPILCTYRCTYLCDGNCNY